MATTAKPWMYPKGTYNVDVGPALQVALDSLGKDASAPFPPKEYYAFNYRYAPDTVDATQKAKVSWDNRDPDKIKLEQSTTQGNDIIFNGTKRRLQPDEWECVLVYDEDTGTYTLERLDSMLDFKYDRAASQSTANRNASAHSPIDDSPNSVVTLSPSSPTTPPANPHFVDQVQISNVGLDLEEGEEPPPVAAKPITRVSRPSMSGKSLSVALPPKKEDKGKRTRDAYDAHEPPARPPPKAPTPPLQAPLSLPQPPRRPPTPPTGARSPGAYGSAGKFDGLDSDDEPPVQAAFSKGFTLEVDENPLPPPPPSARKMFSEGLVEHDPLDTMFDDFDDGDGDAEEAEDYVEVEDGDEEGEEDDDEDGFGAALEDAMGEEPPAPTAKPISLNAYAGGGDDAADWEGEESSEEEWE